MMGKFPFLEELLTTKRGRDKRLLEMQFLGDHQVGYGSSVPLAPGNFGLRQDKVRVVLQEACLVIGTDRIAGKQVFQEVHLFVQERGRPKPSDSGNGKQEMSRSNCWMQEGAFEEDCKIVPWMRGRVAFAVKEALGFM